MCIRIFAVFVGLLTWVSAGATGVASYPTDVEQFMDRRQLCDHYRGEEPYDAERAAFLAKRMELTCTGTDRELRRLKEKYQDDAEIMRVLDQFEEDVEADA